MIKIKAFISALIISIVIILGYNVYLDKEIDTLSNNFIYSLSDEQSSCKRAISNILNTNVIPVFGSSELSSKNDISYPSVMFNNGNSDFNLLMIGRGHFQSLSHSVNLATYAEYIRSKKVVLILSPQWFTKEHQNADMFFYAFYSSFIDDFVKNKNITEEVKDRVLERIKYFAQNNESINKIVKGNEEVYRSNTLNPVKRLSVIISNWFQNLQSKHRYYKLYKNAAKNNMENNSILSADSIDFDKIIKLSEDAGKLACTNNDFFVYDEYFTTYMKPTLEQYKDSQKSLSYLESQEYEDLKTFLMICRDLNIEPLLVSIPVNGWWYDYIGMSKVERQKYYQNIRNIADEFQVKLADFSKDEYTPHFLADIMHLGWKGWAYVNEEIYKFYKED